MKKKVAVINDLSGFGRCSLTAAIPVLSAMGIQACPWKYCGYGEPTCALENLVDSARYVKEHNDISMRLNTNGLGNLYYNKNIVPLLGEVVDTISISLNAPEAARYNEVTRPFHSDAFAYLLKFASECKEYIPTVKLTVVDVLSPEDIEASRLIADLIGVPLRIRKYFA